MKKLIVIFAGFLLILGISSVSMADPFQNGSFEEGPDDIGGFTTLTAPDDSITGWNVSSGSIDLIGTHWAASEGDRSIDLNGGGPGAISQTFDTEPGAVYQVFFDMAGNPDDPGDPDPDLKVIVVSANSETAEYVFDSASATREEMGWTEMSFIFRASSDSTTLEFASTSPDGPYGPALDNVRVIPIGSFPVDITPPAGAVHAYPNLLWPPNNKKVKVKITGYVFDEISAIKDNDGIGVSEVYLLINNRKKIIIKDEDKNLLEPDGSFKIKVPLKAIKGAKYKIELIASDTALGEDGGPNMGLVDQTKVVVPHDMSGKSKDKKKKKPKKQGQMALLYFS
jgi:choice-of-anchor C domain-containing protein